MIKYSLSLSLSCRERDTGCVFSRERGRKYGKHKCHEDETKSGGREGVGRGLGGKTSIFSNMLERVVPQ